MNFSLQLVRLGKCRALSTLPISKVDFGCRCPCHTVTVSYHTSKVRESFNNMTSSWKTKQKLVEYLTKTTLYEDANMLVLTKPNGLPMHALTYHKEVPHDIEQPVALDLSMACIENELKAHFKADMLKVVLSCNRQYSGPVLYAKSEKAANALQKYFKNGRINKILYQKYLMLTTSVPNFDSIEENMLLTRKFINDHTLGVQLDETTVTNRMRESGTISSTRIKSSCISVSQDFGCALLAVETNNTKWDSLHLFALDHLTAILGDHVYSSRLVEVFDKPVLKKAESCQPETQKLQKKLQDCFGLKTEKDIKKLPLHVHCSEITVPSLKKKKETFKINVPVPTYFQKTLESLGMVVNPKEEEERDTKQNHHAI